MGADQSKLDISNKPKHAYHVLKVEPNSPGSTAKLVPYFDYIVSVNGVEVVQEVPNVVAEMAKNHVDRPMKMVVYNSRTDSTREVSIIPSKNWGGKTLLGSSIRFSNINDVIDRVWHVLEVTIDSPAFIAGLIPNKDWIIGSSEIALNSQDDFQNLLIHNQKRPIKLLVFNIEKEAVREVEVVPDFHWGGEGCLGCNIASGALHRIPLPEFDENGVPKPVTFAQDGIPQSTVENAKVVFESGHAQTQNNFIPQSTVPIVDQPIAPATYTSGSQSSPSTLLPQPSISIPHESHTSNIAPTTTSSIKFEAHKANLQPIPGLNFGSDENQTSFLQ